MIPWLVLLFCSGPLDVEGFLQLRQQALKTQTPILLQETLDLKRAVDIRDSYLRDGIPVFGPAIGFKVALSNPAILRRFNLKEPVWGILSLKMLSADGATLLLNQSIRPVIEGDLLLQLGQHPIQQAKTREEALASIEQVAAFIEVPDLVYAPGQALDVPLLTAIDAGANQGVMALPMEIELGKDWIEALSKIEVEIFDESQIQIAQGSTSLLFAHPLDVLLWLRDALAKEGKTLRPGDWISVGSLTPALPVPGPGRYRARYKGFPGVEEVEIHWTFQ